MPNDNGRFGGPAVEFAGQPIALFGSNFSGYVVDDLEGIDEKPIGGFRFHDSEMLLYSCFAFRCFRLRESSLSLDGVDGGLVGGGGISTGVGIYVCIGS